MAFFPYGIFFLEKKLSKKKKKKKSYKIFQICNEILRDCLTYSIIVKWTHLESLMTLELKLRTDFYMCTYLYVLWYVLLLPK